MVLTMAFACGFSSKLTQLEGRPLVIDSGDPELDKAWGGTLEVLTGYEDRVVYPLV